ncbi:hypothetical protein D3C80_481990 [compost metagenome]
MVRAPASMAASMMRQRKSISERPASSQENSTSSQRLRARVTARTACSTTWSGCMRSLYCMWMGLVAMKVWMRAELAPTRASAARSISASTARDRLHTVLSLMLSAMALTASKSPGLAMAKPASITSTRMRSRALAMRSFSSLVIDAPGLCSPSRKVVSKMMTRSLLLMSRSSRPHRTCGRGSG